MPFIVHAGIDAFPAGFAPKETLCFRNDSTSFEIVQRAASRDKVGKHPSGQECSYLRSDTAHRICQDDLAVAR